MTTKSTATIYQSRRRRTISPITCRRNWTPRIIRMLLLLLPLPRSETVLIVVVPLYRSWTTGECSDQRRRAVLYDGYEYEDADADADVKVVVAVAVNNENTVKFIKNRRGRLRRRRQTVR